MAGAAALKVVAPPAATEAQQPCGAMIEELLRVMAREAAAHSEALVTRDEVKEIVAAEVARVQQQAQPAQRLYRAKTVAKLLDVSMGTVWNYAKNGLLPEPIKLSDGLVVFNADAVHAAIDKITGGAA